MNVTKRRVFSQAKSHAGWLNKCSPGLAKTRNKMATYEKLMPFVFVFFTVGLSNRME